MFAKDDKDSGKGESRKVTEEHRGGARENSGGAREGAGRPPRRSGYKTRNWVTVLYPESMAKNWRQTLQEWCCQAFLSPLHDKDVDPDGEPKKPHYHLMTMWDGPKSQGLIAERFAQLGGVGCQPCNSARGYARYLCHLDNPDKHQYPMEAVESFGGASYLDVIALEADRRQTIAEMCAWCRAEGCISFAELCDYAAANKPTWWQAITAHSTMIMFRYIRSIEDEFNKGKYRKPVPEQEKKPEPAKRSEVSELERARVAVENAEIALKGAMEWYTAMQRKEAEISAAWVDDDSDEDGRPGGFVPGGGD